MIKFEKVSFEEFAKSFGNVDISLKQVEQFYDNIKLPVRSTELSAGYDFFAPYTFTVTDDFNTAATINTGIRFVTDRDDIFLMCVPRSGLGFKKKVNLANTAGIIDADYQYAENEGHIKAKMTAAVSTTIEQGAAFMQGIILPFIKTTDDNPVKTKRTGGFGSTDRK